MNQKVLALCPKCGYGVEQGQECGACLIRADRRVEFWTGYFFGAGVVYAVLWLYATWLTHGA